MSHETEDRIVAAVVAARSAVTWRNVVIVALVIALVGMYCAGRSAKARDFAAEQYAANHLFLNDTIKRVEVQYKYRVDTLRIHTKAAAVARVEHDKAVTPVVALLDSGAQTIPASLVLPAIQTCEVALRADSLVMLTTRQAMADLAARIDLQAKRADLAENQLKHGRSRFGYKWGLASGIAITAGLVRLLR